MSALTWHDVIRDAETELVKVREAIKQSKRREGHLKVALSIARQRLAEGEVLVITSSTQNEVTGEGRERRYE